MFQERSCGEIQLQWNSSFHSSIWKSFVRCSGAFYKLLRDSNYSAVVYFYCTVSCLLSLAKGKAKQNRVFKCFKFYSFFFFGFFTAHFIIHSQWMPYALVDSGRSANMRSEVFTMTERNSLTCLSLAFVSTARLTPRKSFNFCVL